MSDKKFKGKILGEPWEALAKGPREALGTIWNDYLAEVLQVSPKSARYKILRRQIETAAGFKEVYENWNTLNPESRAVAWRRLMTASRNFLLERGGSCVRCGECCEIGSPTLLGPDLGLFQREVLTMNDVYTLRPGEKATNREGEVTALKQERLKVREVPGTRQCWFYLAPNQTCRIYADRPEQCRRQNCWGEPPPPTAPEELLQRQHLFGGRARIVGFDPGAPEPLRLRRGGPPPGRPGSRERGGRRRPVRSLALRSLPAPDADRRLGDDPRGHRICPGPPPEPIPGDLRPGCHPHPGGGLFPVAAPGTRVRCGPGGPGPVHPGASRY